MKENEIFKNIQPEIARYPFPISDSFNFYFGQNKNSKDDYRIEVKGRAYYNSEEPKAKTDCRYYLELDITKPNSNLEEDKTLAVMMLNPSNTFPEMSGEKSKIDGTVKNAIRIACKAGYSKVIILNSFNYINADSTSALKTTDKTSNDISIEILKNVLSAHKDLMMAWGAKVRPSDKNNILSVIYELNKFLDLGIYAYAWSRNSNCPYHPATRVDNKKTGFPLTRFLKGETNLIELVVKKQNEEKFELILKGN